MELLIEFSIRLLEWLAPFTLKKLYPIKRIDGLIEIRVSPTGEGIEYWGGDVPRVQAWIEIINLSPFHLKMDRAFGAFLYGSEVAEFTHLKIEKLKPAEKISFPINGTMSAGNAEFIQRLITSKNRNTPEIRFEAHILCRVHDLPIYRRLTTTHHRMVNFANAG